MAANVYEGMFILESGRYGRDPEGVAGQIPQMIEEAGGKILVSRLWEERRLAYPINGQRKGTYWLIYFRIGSDQLTGIKRQCEINDNIMRTLFLKVDPRIVDAVVAHAQTATPSAPPPAEPVAAAKVILDEPAVIVDAIEGVPDEDA